MRIHECQAPREPPAVRVRMTWQTREDLPLLSFEAMSLTWRALAACCCCHLCRPVPTPTVFPYGNGDYQFAWRCRDQVLYVEQTGPRWEWSLRDTKTALCNEQQWSDVGTLAPLALRILNSEATRDVYGLVWLPYFSQTGWLRPAPENTWRLDWDADAY